MRQARPYIFAAALGAGLIGAAAAQDGRLANAYSDTTGSISPPIARPNSMIWSGETGASGTPERSAEAIRAAAEEFPACIAQLWPMAARRGITRQTFQAYTAALT